MKRIICGGGLGDAYLNIIKLYNKSKNEILLCDHYVSGNDEWHMNTYNSGPDFAVIREIYSLHPNLDINIVVANIEEEDMDVYSYFSKEDKIDLEFEYFPVFSQIKDLYKKFNLPEDYICMSLKSGKNIQKHRRISKKSILKIIKENENVVMIGSGIDEEYSDTINLLNKTSILESLSIIMNSKEFHGYQGLHCFFSLSQKIPTKTYIYNQDDNRALKIRCPQPWEQYIEIIRD